LGQAEKRKEGENAEKGKMVSVHVLGKRREREEGVCAFVDSVCVKCGQR
jgi:hypothetical protein